MEAATPIGRRFAEALANKDFDAVERLLDPDVDFRGLTPNRAWGATGAAAVVSEVLRRWLEESDHIDELLSVDAGEPVADCERVSYRFRGHNGEGEFVVEQQAYFTERDGQIVWMRVLCSGFRRS